MTLAALRSTSSVLAGGEGTEWSGEGRRAARPIEGIRGACLFRGLQGVRYPWYPSLESLVTQDPSKDDRVLDTQSVLLG